MLSGDNLLPCTCTGDVLEVQEEKALDVEQEHQCKVCVCKLCEKRSVCKPCLPFCDHKAECDSCFGCEFFKQVKKGIWKCTFLAKNDDEIGSYECHCHKKETG